MIRLADRAVIPASPERVWAWFADMDAHYRDWHPEHITWQTLRGRGLDRDTIVFDDEWVGPFRLAGQFRIAETRPLRFFRWEMLFPFSLVGVGGSFSIAPSDGGCEVLAEVHLGWSMPVLGPVLDRLIASVVALRELRRHMAEESRNLSLLLSTEEQLDESRPRRSEAA
jgi:hypothetical protein